MKTITTLILTCLIWLNIAAQAPHSFNFQAAARDISGNVLANKNVSFRISIIRGSATGTVVFSEQHAKTTNVFGLVNLEIGKGSAPTGSFAAINWGTDLYFIKVEMDPNGGSSFQTMGTSQLLSVPYALHAKTVENISTRLPLPYKDSATVPNVETVFKITCIGNTWSSAITGTSKSTNGTGVVGEGPFGVVGYATAAGGTGVRGVNASTTGSGFGLSGVANSPDAGGIWGSGGLYGIKADAGSSSGYGIYGTASSSSGTTYGVYGRVTSPSGFSGYFTGGKFHVNGRIGIGTVTPSAGLHMKGSSFPESFMFLEADAGQDAGFRIYEGPTAKWHIFNNAGAGGLHIYNNAGTTAIFCKQSNSFVGIGNSNPAYPLHVQGEAAKSTGTTAWVISSDRRLKNVTGPFNKGLMEIIALEPVRFMYRENNSRNLPAGNEQVGFIAQDVQKVFPEAVSQGEDGYLDFNIHPVNVALINAVKELKAENERLQKRIEKLESVMGASAQKKIPGVQSRE